MEGVAMRRRDTSFYYSFLVLPADQRNAIVAVWDFCRAVDDAADEVPRSAAGARERVKADLLKWRSELDACFAGREPATSQGRGLKPCVARFSLTREPFEAVIDGVEMDLDHSRYETFEMLKEYCLRVASAVGLICVQIFGCRGQAGRNYAVDLGVALQLTNIIRDVKGDLERGRLYLPVEDLLRFGCTEDDLRSGVMSERVRALLGHQCDRARTYYAKADRELPAAERRRLVAARIMGAIYLGILKRIERRGYDVFTTVVRVPRPRRAVIAATTWARTVAGF
ncbi:MAG: presqualene diphosphate synthase HpnD [Planctomycetes bacterium]|nr:presqualene diphosphate synthase HpnD [Planctomycetota bacterium]